MGRSLNQGVGDRPNWDSVSSAAHIWTWQSPRSSNNDAPPSNCPTFLELTPMILTACVVAPCRIVFEHSFVCRFKTNDSRLSRPLLSVIITLSTPWLRPFDARITQSFDSPSPMDHYHHHSSHRVARPTQSLPRRTNPILICCLCLRPGQPGVDPLLRTYRATSKGTAIYLCVIVTANTRIPTSFVGV
ncbi:hypothetical protein BJY04DRAFT_134000 [Aspergillus karnatakaensis]|uniref:uncharacterized protein n=1 Tax=Aspergillus karnatakaensis TaxID=1810916 RepID=UPI003CCCCB6A